MLLSLFTITLAQQEFAVADGSSSGTYKQIFNEIKKIAGTELNMTEVAGSGAVENLDKLMSNEANAAFLHSDILAWKSKSDNLDNLKTLLVLFPEQVHFLALAKNWDPGMMKKEKIVNQISDLNGLPVGAAGGGFITANMIRLLSEVSYNVVQFNSGAEVIAALNSGKIAAAVFVGAAPLPNLKELGKNYKLLEVGETTVNLLKSVYKPATVTYVGMSANTVHTISADCILLTRVYKTPKFVEALRMFRQSFCDNLSELQETKGTHKAWGSVDCENHGKWSWYDLSVTPIAKTKR